MSSDNETVEGNGGSSVSLMWDKASGELDGEAEHSEEMRVCAKCGIVEIRGDSAQGFEEDVRSWSKVGSINFMNLRAMLEPHGKWRG